MNRHSYGIIYPMETLYTFVLEEIKQETEDIKTFVFEPQDADFSWTAGQYLDWQLPHSNADDRGERRWFSIASAPSEGVVLLSSRFSPDGSTLKKRLLELSVGDIVQAKGPLGTFTAESNSETLVLVAGGIGITPFRAILKERAARGTLENIVLVYGNRAEDNVPFKAEIDQMAAAHPGFKVVYVYGQHINADLIRAELGSLDGKTYMISGLEKMVAAIEASLQEAGVAKDHIQIDDFGGYDWTLKTAVY